MQPANDRKKDHIQIKRRGKLQSLICHTLSHVLLQSLSCTLRDPCLVSSSLMEGDPIQVKLKVVELEQSGAW